MQEIGSDAAVATGQNRRRGRPLARVQLQPEQSAELQRRVRAATSTQREALRARIILACAEGLNTPEAARICGTHVRTVERWRSRFLRLGLKGLKDRPRPGHKPKFGPVVRLQLIALACGPWRAKTVSVAGLSSSYVKYSQGIVEGISWSSVQRILAQAELRPHFTVGCTVPTRSFVLTELYLNPPPGEACSVSCRWSAALPTGLTTSRVRVQATRNPVTVLRFRCSHGTSRGELRREGRKTSSALWKKSLPTTPKAKCTSSGTISISTTTDPWLAGAISIVATAIASSSTTLQNTPHGSTRWTFFSILQRQCLRDASFCSVGELRAAVLEFIAFWNREKAHPFRWTFTGDPLQSGIEFEKAS